MTPDRSAIFYLSYEAGPDRVPFELPTGDVVFIRAEHTRGDLSEALDQAMPQPGKHVMNTHWLTAELAADAEEREARQ